MVTVITYAVFTAACGLAPNYETLLVFRALQGLGFGGEWAAGAVLMSEYAAAKHRGRTVALIQSSWAVGWGLAVIAYTVIFSFVDEDMAWRVLFFTGALPALLVLYIRRNVKDRPPSRRTASTSTGERSPASGRATCARSPSSRSCSPPAPRAATTRSPPGCRRTSRPSVASASSAPAATWRS